MKKKIVFVSLMVVTFFLGWGVIADQHINAAVHYTHQWKYPVPVQLKNEELADSGKLHYKLYTSTGHLKRIWKVSKNYGALLNAGSYYPLAEATIRGKKFYKVYRYNFKPEREDEETYWGWMRTNDFSSYKKTKYQDEPNFYNSFATYVDSDIPKGPYPSLEGVPNSFAHAYYAKAFQFVVTADFTIRSWPQGDGTAMTGISDIEKYVDNRIDVEWGSEAKRSTKITWHHRIVKPGKSIAVNANDHKYGYVPGRLGNDINGHWLIYKYRQNGQSHVYVVNSNGLMTLDGKPVKYEVERISN